MRICSIASGSNGNCIYMGSDNTSVLIDAGISGKRIEEGLNAFGSCSRDLDAIFVTHEHADHIKGLGVMARRYGIPMYMTKGTYQAVLQSPGIGKIPEGLFHEVKPDLPVMVGDLEVEPFAISHDAADPVGFRMNHQGKSAAVATDMGTYSEYTIRHLQNLDAILLEANHDVRMVEVGRYPYHLKRRILSDHGHLSNESSGQLLCELLHDDMKAIILGHLSGENNYPGLAYETVSAEVTMGPNPYKAKDFNISVARRDCSGSLIEF